MEIQNVLLGMIMGVALAIALVFVSNFEKYKDLDFGDTISKSPIIGEGAVSSNELVVFSNENVHRDIEKDFKDKNEVPVYDESYCNKKYEEKYGREAGGCVVSKISTFSRQDPLIIEVECSCWE